MKLQENESFESSINNAMKENIDRAYFDNDFKNMLIAYKFILL